MQEFWNWYLNLFSSSNNLEVIGVWTATVTTAGFIINYVIRPIYNFMKGYFSDIKREADLKKETEFKSQTATSKANGIDKEAIINKLKAYIEEAKKVDDKVKNNELNPKETELPLVKWKIKVTRFLERNIGVTEAETFLNLRTSLSSGIPMKHYQSSFINHIGFIEILIDEIEEDSEFEPASNDSSLTLNKVKFIYH